MKYEVGDKVSFDNGLIKGSGVITDVKTLNPSFIKTSDNGIRYILETKRGSSTMCSEDEIVEKINELSDCEPGFLIDENER